MKRIVSIVLSILSVLVLFGTILPVGSVASTVGYSDVLQLCVTTGKVGSDGTFDVQIWAKDKSAYGFYHIGVMLKWDSTRVKPVEKSVNGNGVYLESTNADKYVAAMNSAKLVTKSNPSISSPTISTQYSQYITKGRYGANFISLTSSYDLSYPNAFRFSQSFFNSYGIDTSKFVFDSEFGILLATGKFIINDGANGIADIKVQCTDVLLADGDCYNGNSAFSDAISSGLVTQIGTTVNISDVRDTCSVDSTPFDLKTDGYAFDNGSYGFGYDSVFYDGFFSDKIPKSIYNDVFGSSFTQQQYKSVPKWEGNCFGMSVSAILANEGRLKLPGISDGQDVNDYSCSGIKGDWLSGYYAYTDKNSELKKVIERYQVWQDACDLRNDYVDLEFYQIGNNNKGGYISNIIDDYDNYYVELVTSSGGHAMVIDSSRAPVDLGDGWYRLYVYDPNYPYYDGFKSNQTPKSDYSHSFDRYLDVNVRSSQWRMELFYGKELAGYNYDGTYIEGSELIVGRVADSVPIKFDGTAKYLGNNGVNSILSVFACNNCDVYSSSDELVLQVSNGECVYISDDVELSVRSAVDDEGESVFACVLSMPTDDYRVNFTDSGTAQFVNDGGFVGVVSDAETAVCISNDGEVDVSGAEGTTTNVVLENNYDDGGYTSVELNVENTGDNNTNVDLNDSDNLQITSEEDSVSVNVISDELDSEYCIDDVVSQDIYEESIIEYAANNGEAVYNILDATISGLDCLVYTGASQTVDPVISYNGEVLTEGEDYKISGELTVTDVGTYSVTVEGIGEFYETLEYNYIVMPNLMFDEVTTTTGDGLAVEYVVEKELLDSLGYSEPNVIAIVNDQQVFIEAYEETETSYIFKLDRLGLAQMNQPIQAALCATLQGEEYVGAFYQYNITDQICDNTDHVHEYEFAYSSTTKEKGAEIGACSTCSKVALSWTDELSVGDANKDGVINVIDMTVASRHIAQDGIFGDYDLTTCARDAMDINADGVIDQIDLNEIAAVIRAIA